MRATHFVPPPSPLPTISTRRMRRKGISSSSRRTPIGGLSLADTGLHVIYVHRTEVCYTSPRSVATTGAGAKMRAEFVLDRQFWEEVLSMAVLLTGGAGFIGSHVAERLIAMNREVVCLDDFNDYYDPALKWRNVS